MSEQTYIEDPSQWGNYVYITLEQIITDYLANRDSDDYTSHVPRHRILYHAKRSLREFYFDILQEIRAVELDLGSSLQVILPADYVNYVRISWTDSNGNLFTMTENKDLSVSRIYLQDNNYNLLFDDDGNILESNKSVDPESDSLNKYSFCNTGFAPNVDRSKIFENGSYKIDKEEGVIRFSSDVFSKSVVLEYLSDGLYFDTNKGESEDSIKVPKFSEQAIIDRIYYYLIKTRSNIPANEKHRAKKDYYNSRRIAKRRINKSNKEELLQAMRGADVWIKGGHNRSYNNI